MSKESKAVAKSEDKLPVALVANFEESAGVGFEEAGASAYAIPFLQILQSGSPQVKRSEGAFIPGAAEGMLLNTVTSRVYDVSAEGKPVRVVPVHFVQVYIEWKTRENGSGFVAEHPPTTPLATQTVKDAKNRDILPNGNQLVDTRKHYVLVVDEDGMPTPALITMASTQLKKSRRWMSQAANLKFPKRDGTGFFSPPLFAHSYLLTTVPESNDQGSWMGWGIALEGVVQDAGIFEAAKSFHAQVKAGAVKEATPGPTADAQTAAGDADKATF
jgi:hypothetical protein